MEKENERASKEYMIMIYTMILEILTKTFISTGLLWEAMSDHIPGVVELVVLLLKQVIKLLCMHVQTYVLFNSFISKGYMHADPSCEKKGRRFYVPRDECFSEVKQLTFSTKTLHSVLLILLPSLGRVIKDKDRPFSYFHDIDSLFSTGLDLPYDEEAEKNQKGFLSTIMPRVVKSISTTSASQVLRFETPETMNSQLNFIFFIIISFHLPIYMYLCE